MLQTGCTVYIVVDSSTIPSSAQPSNRAYRTIDKVQKPSPLTGITKRQQQVAASICNTDNTAAPYNSMPLTIPGQLPKHNSWRIAIESSR